MPNKRAPDQTLIAFALKEELLQALDAGRLKTGQNRSDFVRSAIEAELRRLGIRLGPLAARAPDRTGKQHAPKAASSGLDPAVKTAVDKLTAAAVKKARAKAANK